MSVRLVRLTVCLLLMLSCGLAACAPPSEVAEAAEAQPTTPRRPTTDPGGEVRPVAAPVDPDHPSAVVYRDLDAGSQVAVCPACSQVQPDGSEKCTGCGLEIQSWPTEWACTLCSGEGRCTRCGDDRACLDCDGGGRCAGCDGAGNVDGSECTTCRGERTCRGCLGDGWRESGQDDFGSGETALPGVCSTCLDGSGACPDCGGLQTALHGETCATCDGSGDCRDCGGTGDCEFDRGVGFCIVCGGAGREVRNAARPSPSTRRWNLRLADGSIVRSEVTARPNPDVVIRRLERGEVKEVAYVPQKLAPLTYYQALRDHTDPSDVEQLLDLANAARRGGLLPLAARDLRRARVLAPQRAAEIDGVLGEVRAVQIDAWLAEAAAARAAGDREGARPLIGLATRAGRGTPKANDAGAALAALEAAAASEQAALSPAARNRAASQRAARASRTLVAARGHLADARKVMTEAERAEPTSAILGRLRLRADRLARQAERLLERELAVSPAGDSAWPSPPGDVLSLVRETRAGWAIAHAVQEVAAGRFDVAAFLAQRALRLDPKSARARRALEAAEDGRARRGVERGSPPTEDR